MGWLRRLIRRFIREPPKEVWKVDRDGRVYRPIRRVVLRGRKST